MASCAEAAEAVPSNYLLPQAIYRRMIEFMHSPLATLSMNNVHMAAVSQIATARRESQRVLQQNVPDDWPD